MFEKCISENLNRNYWYRSNSYKKRLIPKWHDLKYFWYDSLFALYFDSLYDKNDNQMKNFSSSVKNYKWLISRDAWVRTRHLGQLNQYYYCTLKKTYSPVPTARSSMSKKRYHQFLGCTFYFILIAAYKSCGVKIHSNHTNFAVHS